VDADELADRLELRRLIEMYAACCDRRESERFASLFIPEGTFARRHPDGSVEMVADGTEELKTKPLVFRDPPLFEATMHVVANHLCDLAGDTATGLTYCLAHHLERHGDALEDVVLHIWYDDRYLRTAEGWRFVSRVVWNRWRTAQPAELGMGSMRPAPN
jgi:hypothetical protein